MRISVRLLKTYIQEPYTFHLNHNVAVLQRSLIEDTDLFTKGLIHVMELIVEAAVCVTMGSILFNVSQSIAVTIVALLVISLAIFTGLSRCFSKELGKQCQIYNGKLLQLVNQSLGGIKELKILNREKFFIDAY